MANNYQVDAKQLTPNSTVLVKGKLTYSRLAKLIEGEALAAVDAQRVKNGMQAINRPHTSVNISEAEVLFVDPANPTPEEIFVHERRFVSAKHPEHGMSYGIDNKSTKLPLIGVKKSDGTTDQIILEGDLAAGIEVTLVLRVYKPKNYANCGLSLDLVQLHEEPRYYNAGINSQELAARGIIFNTPPVQPAAQAAAPAAAGYPANTDPSTGLPAPAPVVAAVQPTLPVMQPAPVAAAPMAAPVAAPVAAVPVAAPVAQTYETPEQELQRLRAEAAARNTAAAASGGDSAFGDSPWVDPQAPVGAAQGIAYSG